MSITIPVEYQHGDYGFTAVDTDELPPNSSNTTQMVTAELLETILYTINEKLDTIISRSDTNLSVNSNEYLSNIKKLEAIIVPLLHNLLKTADKPYIHWPDRREVIEQQLKAVLAITQPKP